MASKRLPLALYRAMLKWARANSGVPFTLRSSDVLELAPALRGPAFSLLNLQEDAGSLPPLARAAYDACRGLQGAEAEAALDRGLAAVRLLHTTYQEAMEEMRATRSDRADRSGVKFSVGQVFVHKKYGYRGVVYGWDRECQRDDDWLRAMSVSNPRQPFYYVLPDEADSVRLFGGVRISKYVAQENMEPLEGGAGACRVAHRALDAYFTAYSPAQGRYIPSRKLQYCYPDAYQAADAAPIGDDSNILAQPEQEPGSLKAAEEAAPPAGGFASGDGRSFASP